jgi:drug/metabolite transporter superfamily protein YnfA
MRLFASIPIDAAQLQDTQSFHAALVDIQGTTQVTRWLRSREMLLTITSLGHCSLGHCSLQVEL